LSFTLQKVASPFVLSFFAPKKRLNSYFPFLGGFFFHFVLLQENLAAIKSDKRWLDSLFY